jgi:hypothetical protein
MVPIPLYNFLAWVLGMTDDPGFDDHAKVTGEENAKFLSLAQDIIYVSHAGRKPTPKHLALSMTIRQMTGSSGLLKFIHGFWHCASHSTTLRHDTALTELNLQSSTVVPKEILPNKHTTLILDNDDFQEESKSSTHITNGIAEQRALNEDVITIPPLVKTRRKSLDDPCCESMPYSIGKKKSNLEYVVLVFDEAIYAKAQQIRWKNESFMVKTILRLGDFHAVMSFCGAISRIFQDAGLRVCIL